jgi:hypothetical protein
MNTIYTEKKFTKEVGSGRKGLRDEPFANKARRIFIIEFLNAKIPLMRTTEDTNLQTTAGNFTPCGRPA